MLRVTRLQSMVDDCYRLKFPLNTYLRVSALDVKNIVYSHEVVVTPMWLYSLKTRKRLSVATVENTDLSCISHVKREQK